MIIDHQAHWYPAAYLDTIVGRKTYPRAEDHGGGAYRYELGSNEGAWRFDIGSKFTSIEEQIARLDAAGIGAMVLSPNMTGDGAAWVDLVEAKEMLSLMNHETARVQRLYPGRIAGLCMLPLQNTEASMELLEEAVALDLRGILLPSNIATRMVSEEQTWPIYERLNELRWPIFVHPASNSMLYDHELPETLDSSVGWMYDSSVAVFSLILSGLLDRYPNLEIVHAHMGGVVPYIIGRVSRYSGYSSVKLEHPIEYYMKNRVWVDMVTNTPDAIPLAKKFYGLDRLLYGADHPWHDHPTQLQYLRDHMSEEDLHAVLHVNRVPSLRVG